RVFVGRREILLGLANFVVTHIGITLYRNTYGSILARQESCLVQAVVGIPDRLDVYTTFGYRSIVGETSHASNVLRRARSPFDSRAGGKTPWLLQSRLSGSAVDKPAPVVAG